MGEGTLEEVEGGRRPATAVGGAHPTVEVEEGGAGTGLGACCLTQSNIVAVV